MEKEKIMSSIKSFKKVIIFVVSVSLLASFSLFNGKCFAAGKTYNIPKVRQLSAKIDKNCTITLRWKKIKGIKKFDVVYKYDNKGFKKLKTVKTNKLVFKGKFDTKYTFKVRGVKGKKRGKFSTVSFKTPRDSEKDKKEMKAKIAELKHLVGELKIKITDTEKDYYTEASKKEVLSIIEKVEVKIADGFKSMKDINASIEEIKDAENKLVSAVVVKYGTKFSSPYDFHVKVTINNELNKIVGVEDFHTNPFARKNDTAEEDSEYLLKFVSSGGFDVYRGKDCATVNETVNVGTYKNGKYSPGPDAISGATFSSIRYKEAVLAAMKNDSTSENLIGRKNTLVYENHKVNNDNVEINLKNNFNPKYKLELLSLNYGKDNKEEFKIEGAQLDANGKKLIIPTKSFKKGWYCINLKLKGGKYDLPSFTGNTAIKILVE